MYHSNDKISLIKSVSSAIARTLSNNKKLSVEFSDEKLKSNADLEKEIISLSVDDSRNQFFIRGKIDFMCFCERFLDLSIFKKYLIIKKKKRDLYRLIHLVRSIAIGINYFPGSKINIKKFLASPKNQLETFLRIQNGPSFFSSLLKIFMNEKYDLKGDVIRFKKNELDLIKKMKHKINDHVFFSKTTNELVELMDNNSKDDNEYDSGKNSNSDDYEDFPEKNESQLREKESKMIKKEFQIKEVEENDNELSNKGDIEEGSGLAKNTQKPDDNYTVFSKKYDLISNASDLSENNELHNLRKRLDEESPEFDSLVKKLSTKLERKLMAIQYRSWDFDLDEGILDTSKLTRLVIDPTNNLSFKKETESNAKNTVVCLLIDNSGSMRGRPIMIAANAVEVITKTLERCGVKVEILGFTTKEWKGGKSKQDWIKEGRKKKPGRLNDLLHIIYKDSAKSWKVCSKNLGLVLKDGLLKENIDGEALVWASNRLLSKEEKKKIMIVISDGAPVDDSTLSANNSNILESHLSEIVSEIESKKKIDLLAIGIGHDVSKYYKRAFTIDDVSKLAEIMLERLVEIFTNKKS